MLRTILVGLDGSEPGRAALNFSMRLAKRSDALLIGMGCVDEPGIHGPEELLVGEPFFERLNATLLTELRARVDGIVSDCAQRCASEGVAFKPLEDEGTPSEQILMEAQRYDLVVLGRQTHFQFGWEEMPDMTLSRVLSESPRPVIVVPENAVEGEAVLVAYDGSLQAARTLFAFALTGLGKGREIHVLSIGPARTEAARKADRAVEFLKSHELAATAHTIASEESPERLLRDAIRQYQAGLVVMGAYGQPRIREFFLGSTTRNMIDRSEAPLFLSH